MRLWLLPCWIMCDKHLAGEHVECHMFVGVINKGIDLTGYFDNGLLEIHSLRQRHDELVEEMIRRGWNHKSPLPSFQEEIRGHVDKVSNFLELASRCERCRQLLIDCVKENKLCGP